MHYVVTATLRLPAGSVVGLSEAQASPRQHALAPVAKRKGWYEALTDLSFKVGEAIQYQGELPKALANAVEAPKRQGRDDGGGKGKTGPDGGGNPEGGGDSQEGGEPS